MMTQKFRYGSSILILNLLHDAGKKAVQPDLVPEFSNGLHWGMYSRSHSRCYYEKRFQCCLVKNQTFVVPLDKVNLEKPQELC